MYKKLKGVVNVSGNSIRYTKKGVTKQIVLTACITTFLVAGAAEYSVDNGLITFAQGKIEGNLVENINVAGLTLKEFSKIPSIKDAIVFVEEIDENENGEIQLMSLDNASIMRDVPEINLMSISEEVEGVINNIDIEDVEKALLESYGLSSDYKVTLGDEVGVSSETKKLVTPGTPTNRYSTLLEVRSAAKHVDETYEGKAIKLDKRNRELVERLVQGEAGAEGFIGAALVAQTIRDTMLHDNCYDLMKIKKSHGYTGSLKIEPNQEVKDAVSFIFDKGGYVVKHRLMYFYAFKLVKSPFHEAQKFIIEHGGHRFFDERIR